MRTWEIFLKPSALRHRRWASTHLVHASCPCSTMHSSLSLLALGQARHMLFFGFTLAFASASLAFPFPFKTPALRGFLEASIDREASCSSLVLINSRPIATIVAQIAFTTCTCMDCNCCSPASWSSVALFICELSNDSMKMCVFVCYGQRLSYLSNSESALSSSPPYSC